MQRDLGKAASQEEFARAFGSVAADNRPRGNKVLSFLQTTLGTASDSEIRLAAAKALSMTNLPVAADILTKKYGSMRREVVKPLFTHGRLGSPFIGKCCS